MLKKTLAIAVASTLLGASGTTFAAGHGNAGGGMGVGTGISSTSGAGMSTPRTAPEAAVRNSNGSNAVDRDKGLDRAEDRRSAQGTANANNRSMPNRATGTERAADRKAMKSSALTHRTSKVGTHTPIRTRTGLQRTSVRSSAHAQTREERMEAARANWAKNRKL